MKENQVYFLLFVSSIFFFIISPTLLSDGMFMDGIYYATISRNWAEGIGTFWEPYFTATQGAPFYEHPPLMFFLEGVFFKLLGNHFWIERIYSLITHLVMGVILWRLWLLLCNEKYRRLFWIPLLFWISVSKVTWSACNNLLENTLMLFTSIAVLFLIKSIKSQKGYFVFFAGLFIFLGFLTKGLVALFPLSFPFFFWIFNQEYSYKQLFKDYILLLSGLFIPFIFIYIFMPSGISFFENYWQIQVVNSLEHVQTVDSRFFILRKLFEESLIMIIVTTILIIWNKYFFHYKLSFAKKEKSILFTLICLVFSGVLPILISLKQNTFYINPVFPFVALILGLFIAPIVSQLSCKINWSGKRFRMFKVISIVFFITSISMVVLSANEISRDKEKLSDIRAIIKEVEENKAIYLSPEIRKDWSLHAYFYRYGYISLYGEDPENFNFMICSKNTNPTIPSGYKIYRGDLNELDLYRKD